MDPPGDAGGNTKPDIVKIVVSDDADGTLHWTVSYTSSNCISNPGDSLEIWIDSDNNPATGYLGADYVIYLDGSGNATLYKTNGQPGPPGQGWTSVGPASPECVSAGDEVSINKSQAGIGSAFNFSVWTDNGGDKAPDSGMFTYTLSAGQSPPP